MLTHSDELRFACLRHIAEGRRILADMGVTDSSIRVLYCLIMDQRPWSISAIANATGLSRLTVRQAVISRAERGVTVKTADGYRITEFGVERFRERFDEFFEKIMEPMLQFHRILASEYSGFEW